jgi:predicted RNase H-like nuclease (RuvC/YqgF family)
MARLEEEFNTLYQTALKFEKKYNRASQERDELSDRCDYLSEELKTLKTSDKELKTEIRELKRVNRVLKRQSSGVEDKYKDKIAKLERDIILRDGKIQQLEDSRRDLQERYQELKTDFREQRKWVMNGMSRAGGVVRE